MMSTNFCECVIVQSFRNKLKVSYNEYTRYVKKLIPHRIKWPATLHDTQWTEECDGWTDRQTDRQTM